MLPLLKINLLPYREALQAKKKKEFQTLMLAAILIGLVLAGLCFFIIDNIIRSHEHRVIQLQNGIKKLDDEVAQISKLKEERKNFMARQQKVEELSNRRFEAAYILDTLNNLAPEGLFVTSIDSQNPNTYIITGRAYSDSRTAAFMSALPGRLFSTPELLNIRRVNNAQEFSIRVHINNIEGPIEESINFNQPNNAEISAPEQSTDSQQNSSNTLSSAASN